MISLSDNFTLHEFTRSQTAARLGKRVTIDLTSLEYANLVTLCKEVLQPLRGLLYRPITITSGYRPAWLNEAVGGSDHSAHLEGRAADIVISGMTPRDVAFHLAHSGLPFDQCIVEFGQWVHISIAKPGEEPRRQVLTASKRGNATIYKDGL
ncbi:D-Ala-D-Ala carboxypeptidase family metallohydrolase [Maridesulfovibrio bastinii]|uniref:D-Ala-D-Ala carboxypeptidase family metallohydrolase n=1 Tax=Maridesulfovibrio bastinii TaxID=47157 RepID=UPI000405BF42|nr:D-Ala-D-Ala carboxypeptidase family metallohydrolase [Maridesulfovibrio bastinii]